MPLDSDPSNAAAIRELISGLHVDVGMIDGAADVLNYLPDVSARKDLSFVVFALKDYGRELRQKLNQLERLT